MVTEKDMRLTEAFFGHAAAVAATVHLYYCRAADPRLKFKSKTDLAKCRRFLEGFVEFSPACRALVSTAMSIRKGFMLNVTGPNAGKDNTYGIRIRECRLRLDTLPNLSQR